MEGDVATGDHLGRVPLQKYVRIETCQDKGGNSHIVVDLDLREQGNMLRF